MLYTDADIDTTEDDNVKYYSRHQISIMYLFVLYLTLNIKKKTASSIPHVDRTDIDMYM